VTQRSVALVSGASRGIGRAIVEALQGIGYTVVGLARSASEGPPEILACDVADLARHDDVFTRIAGRHGRLDLFVSNAGIAPAERRDILETTPASFDRVLDTNLRGAFFLAQQAARMMLAGRDTVPGWRPRMVFITSVSARTASRSRVEYCVSKAGLSMVARVFAERLAGDGIPVFEVRPGIIHTDMTAPVQEKYDAAIAGGLVPQRRWGEPADVARTVAALARGDFDYATGSVIDVGGGLHLPRL
jgi:NAD(P)-dependent dehydrogenase (short-subunit alcohol dehydrogenase family)